MAASPSKKHSSPSPDVVCPLPKRARKNNIQPQKIIDEVEINPIATEWYEAKDKAYELKMTQEQLEQNHSELRDVKNEKKQVEEDLQVLRLALIDAAKRRLNTSGKDECFFRTNGGKLIKCNQIARSQDLKDKETWPVIKELAVKAGVTLPQLLEIETELDSYRMTRQKQLTYTLLQG